MMNSSFSAEPTPRIELKQTSGWFAAGDAFERATHMLSDGAFKLFAHLCLRADRRTGRYEATQKQLAHSLGKSRRIIGCYASEVQAKRVCKVQSGSNQFARTVFEICDDYWPYKRNEPSPGSSLTSAEPTVLSTNEKQGCSGTNAVASENHDHHTETAYVDAVRNAFMSSGCTRGLFRSVDEEVARSLYHRGVPLPAVKNALDLGAVRKYVSWLNGSSHEMIATLKYFEPLLDEVLRTPFPPGYEEYLARKLKEFRKEWLEKCKARS